MATSIDNRIKHGMRNTSEYRSWADMLQRCSNPKSNRYKDYGGRGISVCDSWLTFENFYADMGDKPSKSYSIDRIDNEGDYTPKNCKWSNPTEQVLNQRLRKDNKHGVKGIFFNKQLGKYTPRLTVSGTNHNLGCYTDWFEAVCARKSAEIRYGN